MNSKNTLRSKVNITRSQKLRGIKITARIYYTDGRSRYFSYGLGENADLSIEEQRQHALEYTTTDFKNQIKYSYDIEGCEHIKAFKIISVDGEKVNKMVYATD